jgi:hypothetical protein
MARSSRNDLHYHHSEVFKSPLLFEGIMGSSSGKLKGHLCSREGGPHTAPMTSPRL